MGWKWNDYAETLQAVGGFTDEQIATIETIVTAKKQELADILESLASVSDSQRVKQAGHMSEEAGFQKGRASAFREVRDGVKPQ